MNLETFIDGPTVSSEVVNQRYMFLLMPSPRIIEVMFYIMGFNSRIPSEKLHYPLGCKDISTRESQ